MSEGNDTTSSMRNGFPLMSSGGGGGGSGGGRDAATAALASGRIRSNSSSGSLSKGYYAVPSPLAGVPGLGSVESMSRIGSHGSIPSFNSQGSMQRIGSHGSITMPLSPGNGLPGVWENTEEGTRGYIVEICHS